MRARFVAPETSSAAAVNLRSSADCPAWDVAIRYRDISESRAISEVTRRRLRRAALEEILRRARSSAARPLRPERPIFVGIHCPSTGPRFEPDMAESIEAGYRRTAPMESRFNALRIEARSPIDRGVVVGLDTSLSMQGEKLALLAVTAAALAMVVPSSSLAIFAFESRVHEIKGFADAAPPQEIVERLLRLPGGGLTNLERALKEARRLASGAPFADPRVLLISDGKYTEGCDPAALAHSFRSLNVLKPGRDRAGRGLLEDLCRPSGGTIFGARSMTELPRATYSAIRALMR